MIRKPLIVYAEHKSFGLSEHNYDMEALKYYLKNDCACDVIHYEHSCYIEENLTRLIRSFKFGTLVLIIIKQGKYDDEYLRTIKVIRERISNTLPIIIIKESLAEVPFDQNLVDEFVFSTNHGSKNITDLIKQQFVNWTPPFNWLGPENEEEENLLMIRLENAYRQNHHDEEDGMLGTPNHNHQIVAEALRLSMIPSVFLKEELDEVSWSSFADFLLEFSKVVISPSFDEDFSKIKSMTKEQQEELSELISKASGYSNGYRTRETLGNLVNGFAIDTITHETLITTRYGSHRAAKEMLSYRIASIEELKTKKYKDDKDCLDRLISGYIYHEIPGFKTPLLVVMINELRHGNEEAVRETLNFLLQSKKLIPISYYGKLFVG